MRLLLIILIVAAFCQSAFLPVNICLVLIICRSFVEEYKSNLVAAFAVGIFLGFLSGVNMGFWAITFLLVCKSVHIIRSLPALNSTRLFLPFASVFILIPTLAAEFFIGQKLNFVVVIIEILLCIPFYLLLRVWEDRFLTKNEVKLKIRS